MRSVTGTSSTWNTSGGPPRSRVSNVTTAARFAPELTPPTEMRPASMPSWSRVVDEPLERGEAVFGWNRELVARCEPVTDRGDDTSHAAGGLAALSVGLIEGREPEPTAGEIEMRGKGTGAERRVDPDRDLAPRDRDPMVGDGGDLRWVVDEGGRAGRRADFDGPGFGSESRRVSARREPAGAMDRGARRATAQSPATRSARCFRGIRQR